MTTRPVLDDLLVDLAAQCLELEAQLAPLTEEQWRTATPAEGWDIAHQIVHLAWADESAVLAATDEPGWQLIVDAASDDPDGFVDAAAAYGAEGLRGEEILQRWRHARETLAEVLAERPDGEQIPWFGPPMSAASMATARLMETWAHGHDVADALGHPVEPDDRIRHVCHLGVRTRDYAYAVNDLDPPGEEFRVELTSPSGETWAWGPEDAAQSVSGPAYDFALLATQRRHRDDLDLVATGEDAEGWLRIAQAFAGTPGTGREATR